MALRSGVHYFRVKPCANPERKSSAGRKRTDVVLMFKILVLQHLYNLADEQTEYQVRDRLSFQRFLGLTPEARVPDARTLWLFREHLTRAQAIEPLFQELGAQIEIGGFQARRGQILDAALVPAPRQRNSRSENAEVKAGTTPAEWSQKKVAHKDTEATWTKKHGQTHYGYKNHVAVDREHKLIREWQVTTAAVHDSQVFDDLLDRRNTSRDVWADAAYRARDREADLQAVGFRSHIHRKAAAGRPLNERAKEANRKRSQVRARVEHVFADQTQHGGRLVRTIGIARAKVKVGMMNLVYNLRRWAFLERRLAVGMT